jgi:gluconate 2-dehydrogenase gamma chain
MAEDQPRVISRRDILRGAGLVGAAALGGPISSEATSDAAAAAAAAGAGQAAVAAPREAFENLTATEADLLETIVERLIPSDEHGPGAREARAAHYIDRALGGALASSRAAYSAGLAALDRYATASRGKPFLQLSPSDQDSVLLDCETGGATGFTGSSAQFFNLLLGHTRQGMFGDPYYGGNANFVGWDLLGYPGVRTMVTQADQKALEANTLKPNHRSAYDYETFNKATARAGADGDEHHGD